MKSEFDSRLLIRGIRATRVFILRAVRKFLTTDFTDNTDEIRFRSSFFLSVLSVKSVVGFLFAARPRHEIRGRFFLVAIWTRQTIPYFFVFSFFRVFVIGIFPQ
ncbi:MAG: hypothetical protein K8T89_03645 [Planctomycetes bacterium]|nr:hypothetical protein [Planctomycetota bacterium]